MKNPWVVIGLITVLLFGGAIWYSSVAAEKNNEGVEVQSHTKGDPNSPAILVEFSDLQCPACKAAQPAVSTLLAEYGENIYFEYKHFPLPIHPFAIEASMAAEAAGQQGKFFEYHDLLFENQATWASTQGVPTAFFVQYAEELGLDIPQFRRHMNASLLREKVQADQNEGRARGVQGTPTFFLNGEKLEYNTYQELMAQVLAKAYPESVQASTSANESSAASGVRFGL